MSAYLVSEKHIGLIAAYAHKHELTQYGICYGLGIESIKEITTCLAKANLDSVDYRYKQDTDNTENKIYINNSIDHAKAINPDVFPAGYIAKQLDCFEYQSCEPENWYQSNAFKILANIRAELVKQFDDYENASWGMEY